MQAPTPYHPERVVMVFWVRQHAADGILNVTPASIARSPLEAEVARQHRLPANISLHVAQSFHPAPIPNAYIWHS